MAVQEMMTYDDPPDTPKAVSGFFAVERGCGTRSSGGIYCVTGVGHHGMSVEDCILDPPIPLDTSAGFPLPIQGVSLIHGPDGNWHLLDRVGLVHYPYPADIIEETRRFGLSRRVQKSLKVTVDGKTVNGFSLLTPGSRILLAHDRAYIKNWKDYITLNYHGMAGWDCPNHNTEHFPYACKEPCSGLWWRDLPEPPDDTITVPVCGNPSVLINPGVYTAGESTDQRAVLRVMPSFAYDAKCRPKGVEPQYHAPALFASFPITAIHVINGEGVTEAMNAAAPSALPAFVMDN